MQTLYVSTQGCYLCLEKELIVIKKQGEILNKAQLPLLEQILIFGQSHLTTQAIRACLFFNIPIVYLSRMGYCYGRTIAIDRGYRQLARYQQQVTLVDKLIVARQIVTGKLNNCKIILQRQQRKKSHLELNKAIQSLDHLKKQVANAEQIDRLMGYEGAGAAIYFPAFGKCISNTDFLFYHRSRRPPTNEINALLSFGYQILWNHLFALIEIQGLDPYYGCLHQDSTGHAVLASDLIEEFRASIVDSLVLYLVNKKIIKAETDFVFRDGGCFLSDLGRRKYLRAFLTRMEETVTNDKQEKLPRWELLMQQVRKIKQFFYHPINGYQPYLLK